MAKELICVDTTLFIEYYRQKDKANGYLTKLEPRYRLAITVITKMEILFGSNDKQNIVWEKILRDIEIFDFKLEEAEVAAQIFQKLKKKNQMVGLADLLIGATAVEKRLRLATLNKAYFKRIPWL